MVRGIEKFKEFFVGYEDNYVIIGGTACEVHEEIYAQNPRATKDIDIILIVEALSSDFVAKFWEFVKVAGYVSRNKGTGEGEQRHEYYRFKEPSAPEFPYQVELFSRNPGLVNFPEDAHITPVPVDEDLSSLSAILMDDDYYNFTIAHSRLEYGVHIANIESLICLKCKAYLEMLGRKDNGEQVDSRHIAKHKKDVFRLAAMLSPADIHTVPDTLKKDIDGFCGSVKDELPNADFFKSAGLKDVTAEQLLKQLKDNFTTQ
ncbi:hypothetical protein PL674_05510 [Phocaeicola vulgatus]|jgi:hypothetical protein|uniref:Nucleotidyl transferase AbiEii/AbiGii toxin family protein n=2 Tax=Bacteroidaceae TaxID=815 RepID=A0A414HGD7_BACT4|nr:MULTISPECIES: hypothetical protein [Bacteroidaceae]DAI58884.1 MAG TPA: Nucleotidyltransferase [Herelleviridae sp.]DAV56488.1 MAG TPA: Nucleotidyltransferase [Bacteriophage sp.]AUI45584.1 hypothetical protein BUN20_02535 [Bacteroides fragilis]MCM0331182.1 hypothetical protein [Bacteroides fragilis]MDB0988532.1 hypothetical protein [Phocaeicola vulgatus]